MIEAMKAAGKTNEEILVAVMAVYGVGKTEGQFIIDVETGVIPGDVIEIKTRDIVKAKQKKAANQ